jgi:hypothetical protein
VLKVVTDFVKVEAHTWFDLIFGFLLVYSVLLLLRVVNGYILYSYENRFDMFEPYFDSATTQGKLYLSLSGAKKVKPTVANKEDEKEEKEGKEGKEANGDKQEDDEEEEEEQSITGSKRNRHRKKRRKGSKSKSLQQEGEEGNDKKPQEEEKQENGNESENENEREKEKEQEKETDGHEELKATADISLLKENDSIPITSRRKRMKASGRKDN